MSTRRYGLPISVGIAEDGYYGFRLESLVALVDVVESIATCALRVAGIGIDSSQIPYMKTMTRKQPGCPCGYLLKGGSADEVIKAQDRHLNEMVTGGDDAHEAALKATKDRWKHPIAGMRWHRQVKSDFAALGGGDPSPI